MKHLVGVAIGVGMTIVLNGMALGAVNTFEVNASPHVQISTSTHPSGATNVTITQLSTAVALGDVYIETTANDPLGIIDIKNQSALHPVEVHIRGAGGDESKRPASLVQIIGGNGADNANEIVIRECHVVGPIDHIGDVNLIDDLVIGGGRVLYITLDHASYLGYEPPAVINSTIGGRVGAIYLSYQDSRIDNVELKETLGVLGLSSFIHTDHIGTLRIGGVAAGSSIRGATTQFINTVHQIELYDTDGGTGEMAGQLWVDELESAGSIPGAIIVENGIAATGVLGFKERLVLNEGEVDLPQNGLAGRVVIGADGSNGIWTGPIKIGTTITLTGPYTNDPNDLGGGMAGAVPFQVHTTFSTPTFGTNFAFSTSPLNRDFKFEHYGWVFIQDEDAKPIRLERRARCIGDDWLDVTDEWDFKFSVANNGQSPTLYMDTTGSPAHYRNGFEYRFVCDGAGDDALYCYLETLPPPVFVPVAPYPSDPWFSVGSECPWDTNGDSTIDATDLNSVLGDWQQVGNNLQGDINGDGITDTDDLNHVLAHWQETSCAGCGGESLLMGGGGNNFAFESEEGAGALMAALGYTSVAEFCAAIDGMNSSEQDAMLAALAAAAQE